MKRLPEPDGRRSRSSRGQAESNGRNGMTDLVHVDDTAASTPPPQAVRIDGQTDSEPVDGVSPVARTTCRPEAAGTSSAGPRRPQPPRLGDGRCRPPRRHATDRLAPGSASAGPRGAAGGASVHQAVCWRRRWRGDDRASDAAARSSLDDGPGDRRGQGRSERPRRDDRELPVFVHLRQQLLPDDERLASSTTRPRLSCWGLRRWPTPRPEPTSSARRRCSKD